MRTFSGKTQGNRNLNQYGIDPGRGREPPRPQTQQAPVQQAPYGTPSIHGDDFVYPSPPNPTGLPNPSGIPPQLFDPGPQITPRPQNSGQPNTQTATTQPSTTTTAPPMDVGNMGNINTTINPLITYAPEQTETARNQILATQAQSADPRWLMKRFATPGRSMDAGIASAATPFLAQSQFLGNQGYANLSLGDALANQESLLAGEIAREKEGIGLGNLLSRLNELQTAGANSFLTPLLNSLMR